MPVMTDNNRSVAANATVDNILAGKLDEFLRVNSQINLFAIAQAVGVRFSLNAGGETILDDQEINARAGAIATIVPDDFICDGAGFAGDRVIVRIRNTTAAPIIVCTRVELSPI